MHKEKMRRKMRNFKHKTVKDNKAHTVVSDQESVKEDSQHYETAKDEGVATGKGKYYVVSVGKPLVRVPT